MFLHWGISVGLMVPPIIDRWLLLLLLRVLLRMGRRWRRRVRMLMRVRRRMVRIPRAAGGSRVGMW